MGLVADSHCSDIQHTLYPTFDEDRGTHGSSNEFFEFKKMPTQICQSILQALQDAAMTGLTVRMQDFFDLHPVCALLSSVPTIETLRNLRCLEVSCRAHAIESNMLSDVLDQCRSLEALALNSGDCIDKGNKFLAPVLRSNITKLSRLSLGGLDTNGDALLDFIRRQGLTLEELYLSQCFVRPTAGWQPFLEG